MAFCTNCGKALEENEKFCSGCGTPTETGSSKPPENKEPEEPKYTKEGKKIISGGPKSDQNRQTYSPPPPTTNPKKKKKGCRGCAFAVIIILVVLVVGTMLAYNKVSDWWKDYKTEMGVDKLDTEGVDGIVDIEEGDVNHLPENRDKKQSQSSSSIYEAETGRETKGIKATCDEVEDAFANADVEQLKSLLTTQSKLNYTNQLDKIQPHMKEYAKAFKQRKLVAADQYFALYSFKDEDGTEHTVEFALNDNGEWKIVRF